MGVGGILGYKMDTNSIFQAMGMFAAIFLPLFNIPLIIRIVKRKSSQDISLVWAIGVWIGILMMAPSGLTSQDIVWRTFNYTNVILFTCVVIATLKYRKG